MCLLVPLVGVAGERAGVEGVLSSSYRPVLPLLSPWDRHEIPENKTKTSVQWVTAA